jgi:hypothetical protein
MAITFKNKITLCLGAMFRFGTFSCIADEEGALHRVADPPENKPFLGIQREAKARLRTAPSLAARGKMILSDQGSGALGVTPLVLLLLKFEHDIINIGIAYV